MTLAVDRALSLADARKVAEDLKEHARGHLPALEHLHLDVVPALRPTKT
jgi:divalent metal cation (Fe/Co/Zn/Cd) transporter